MAAGSEEEREEATRCWDMTCSAERDLGAGFKEADRIGHEFAKRATGGGG